MHLNQELNTVFNSEKPMHPRNLFVHAKYAILHFKFAFQINHPMA